MVNRPTINWSLPPNPAEAKFADCIAAGKPYVIGEAAPSQKIETGEGANVIRAGMIRSLIVGDGGNTLIEGNDILLRGAWIHGDLDLSHIYMPYSVRFINCYFDGGVLLNYSKCRLLSMEGSHLAGYMIGKGVIVDSDVRICDGFFAECGVLLSCANIGGDLLCGNSVLKQRNKFAFAADEIQVGGSVRMKETSIEGVATLSSARIGKILNLHGSHLKNNNGKALFAESMSVGNDILMGNGFTAEGGVYLTDTGIGGHLLCNGGNFKNPGQFAIYAERISTKGNVFMDSEFIAEGDVMLSQANISNLYCRGGVLNGTLNMERAKIRDSLVFENASGNGMVDLFFATTDILSDDKISREKLSFNLRGFSYARLIHDEDVQSRIDWLNRQATEFGFFRQQFEHAAKVLFAMGHNEDARSVLFAMEKRVTEEKGLSKSPKLGRKVREWTRKALRWIWGTTIGYNHKLGRMLATSAVIVFVGAVIFGVADSRGYIVPHQPVVLASAKYKQIVRNEKAHVDKCSAAKRPRLRPTNAAVCLFPGYPRFDALWFSMDIFLPTSPLHQELYWYPHPRAENAAWRYLLLTWYWFQVIVGWVLTSTFVLVITGIMQRSQVLWGSK